MRWVLLSVVVGLVCGSAALGAAKDRPDEGKLKVGDAAPDFELKQLEGEGTVKLSGFKDKKPVVLIFGSYT
jgi:cytochrome oxidase Cu insertion factor (SCO1/SenC/PrrC family)